MPYGVQQELGSSATRSCSRRTADLRLCPLAGRSGLIERPAQRWSFCVKGPRARLAYDDRSNLEEVKLV
jgi:hypothetical protein